ncbi:hypothetical protein GCM10011608_53680 [Micromonospora sonchi]|uniref:Uncharacterized protein n=1 Tax=Micromonospora sonchi TaxID=1763543 RepID=A0A917U662_9ACTN|nr:hypothetical protein [Micromonospora sonchi]GGM61808.1 hypothetical protein GCM10011608_53680 [Micromonospora sonchi]
MASIEQVKAELAQAAEQSKQRLIEAATVLQGSTQAARQYISILG